MQKVGFTIDVKHEMVFSYVAILLVASEKKIEFVLNEMLRPQSPRYK